MLKEALADNLNGPASHDAEGDKIDPAVIREELNRIVSSRHFQTSRRSKEFLRYVVNQKISGNGDLLKERLIGIGLFKRKPNYAAGEDPVVRVRASDVRRRLELYYADTNVESDILIQIPLGSYAPVFRLKRESPAHKPSASEIAQEDIGAEASRRTYALQQNVHVSGIGDSGPGYDVVRPTVVELPLEASTADGTATPIFHEAATRSEAHSTFWPKRGSRQRVIFIWGVVLVLACVALLAYLITSYFHRPPESALKAFWLPASVSSKPVLLCMPKPTVYRPSNKLFDRYRKVHPNALATREAREDQFLPLDPTDTIQWGDMMPDRDSGPGLGGVVAAINISKILTEQGIRFELRFGEEASFADMRSSPVVIIGAINTDWATQLISESRFVFDETPGAPNIHELGGVKRVWKMETDKVGITRDYGLITRQLSGNTGQFLVQVAGISHFGTAAASELLTQQQELAEVLHAGSISLQKNNLQIVVSTDITDGRAGPPHVVAFSSW